jgi:hypothetical protein
MQNCAYAIKIQQWSDVGIPFMKKGDRPPIDLPSPTSTNGSVQDIQTLG